MHNFLSSQPKYMLCLLKRTVSMRWFFWAPKTSVKTDGYENIYDFTLQFFAYLDLCLLSSTYHCCRAHKLHQAKISQSRYHIVCFEPLSPSRQFFSHVWIISCFPGLKQYQAADTWVSVQIFKNPELSKL